jgi:hypothetical protein
VALRISLGGRVAAGAGTCAVSAVAGRDVKGHTWCRAAGLCRRVAQSEQTALPHDICGKQIADYSPIPQAAVYQVAAAQIVQLLVDRVDRVEEYVIYQEHPTSLI